MEAYGYIVTDQFLAHDLELDQIKHYDEIKEKKKHRWQLHMAVPKHLPTGDILYRINNDFSLTLVMANYDTSD